VKLFVSPRGFLVRALLIALAFGVVHALGWREETRFLSGTPASLRLGVFYLFFYFAFVLVAPTLVLGAGIFAVLERLTRQPEGSHD
jgi:phosphotransferase system  glucose/maltose/N-acetylglucosamine-specific IIC component